MGILNDLEIVDLECLASFIDFMYEHMVNNIGEFL